MTRRPPLLARAKVFAVKDVGRWGRCRCSGRRPPGGSTTEGGSPARSPVDAAMAPAATSSHPFCARLVQRLAVDGGPDRGRMGRGRAPRAAGHGASLG